MLRYLREIYTYYGQQTYMNDIAVVMQSDM